jgi:alkanesulfonate monooxygenase SsuD/methylene tetrahydromethanopterin reductase-like flavin-dependent oxidoreductase (luciferase family)
MKYGIAIRNMGPQSTRDTIVACARAAEQIGFDALFVSDHLALPPDDVEGSGGRYLDVLATLAFLAGTTERIRLGVSVLVLPYRPAVLTAKQVATIQELSGGRMILATGVGWVRREFEALGVDPQKRGALTTETLRVLHHLFASPTTSRPMTVRWYASHPSCFCRVRRARRSGSAARAITQWRACWNSATDGIRCSRRKSSVRRPPRCASRLARAAAPSPK